MIDCLLRRQPGGEERTEERRTRRSYEELRRDTSLIGGCEKRVSERTVLCIKCCVRVANKNNSIGIGRDHRHPFSFTNNHYKINIRRNLTIVPPVSTLISSSD